MKIWRMSLATAFVAIFTMIMPENVHAAPLFEGVAVGGWTDPNASFGFVIANTDPGGTASVNWGTAASTPFSNEFTFDGVGSDGDANWTAAPDAPFKVGAFTYRNGSVVLGSHNFNGIDLSITLSLTSPLVVTRSFAFSFGVTNTPNETGDPVLDGDIVTLLGGTSLSSFAYDGAHYTLELIGFSSDGGATLRTDFSSPEGANAGAQLFGTITLAQVPGAASLLSRWGGPLRSGHAEILGIATLHQG